MSDLSDISPSRQFVDKLRSAAAGLFELPAREELGFNAQLQALTRHIDLFATGSTERTQLLALDIGERFATHLGKTLSGSPDGPENSALWQTSTERLARSLHALESAPGAEEGIAKHAIVWAVVSLANQREAFQGHRVDLPLALGRDVVELIAKGFESATELPAGVSERFARIAREESLPRLGQSASDTVDRTLALYAMWGMQERFDHALACAGLVPEAKRDLHMDIRELDLVSATLPWKEARDLGLAKQFTPEQAQGMIKGFLADNGNPLKLSNQLSTELYYASALTFAFAAQGAHPQQGHAPIQELARMRRQWLEALSSPALLKKGFEKSELTPEGMLNRIEVARKHRAAEALKSQPTNARAGGRF